MALGRYDDPDDYTLEEFRREYSSRDIAGKLRLLQEAGETGLPESIMKLAVEDPNVLVRQWMAKNYKFFWHSDEHFEVLKNDSDDLVRVAARENDAFLDVYSDEKRESTFKDASRLERLGLMRNPRIPRTLAEKIVDPSDASIVSDLQERKALVLAYLSNAHRLLSVAELEKEQDRMEARTDAHSSMRTDVSFAHFQQREAQKEHLDRLWKLAGKWLELERPDASIPALVYSHVPVSDDTKAEVYLSLGGDYPLRISILESCTDADNKTVALGLKDPDEFCRTLAEEKAPPPEKSPEKKRSRFVGYAWTCFLGGINVAVALAIFAAASSKFETIIFALIVLIYIAVCYGNPERGIFAIEQAVVAAQRHARLLELLKDPQFDPDTKEFYDEDLNEARAALQTAQAKLWIGSLFWGLSSLIALYNLFKALFE